MPALLVPDDHLVGRHPHEGSTATAKGFVKPLLANPALKPSHADLLAAEAQSETLLRIRRTNLLLHLGSAAAIQQKVSFPGSGPGATPGVIV